MARKYPMTVEAIVTSYRQAKNQQTQIGVLADLNVCTRKEIKELLTEAGALQQPLCAAAPSAVTVKSLRALLDAAEAAGYGDVPLEVKGCRFAEMHLRVETLIGAEAPGTLVELMATPAEA